MEAILGFLIPILFAIVAFLLAISLIPSPSVLSARLDVLKAAAPPAQTTNRFAFFERLFSSERRAMLWKQLAEAGWYTDTPTKFALRVLAGGCAGAAFALLFWKLANFSAAWLIPLTVVLAFCGAYTPYLILDRAIEARKTAIHKALPEFLDMVASTVQAGLALNAALAYAVDAAPGPLGEEIKEALSEIRLGRSRSDALKAVGERTNQPDLRNALRVITQADRLGANIAKLLTELAEDARHRRLMLVEEMAAKLPVKMAFPMVLFMMPSIFVIIFGTIVANYFAPKP
jgi:tight adherence protein C